MGEPQARGCGGARRSRGPLALRATPDSQTPGASAARCAPATRNARGAFTLLEVILALAILGLALSTLGMAVGRSHDNARKAADETELCFAAQSALDELLAGVRPFAAFDGEGVADPLDPTAPAVAIVSASIENGPFDGVLVVRVRARPNLPDATEADVVELVRWMVDPSLEGSADESEAAL